MLQPWHWRKLPLNQRTGSQVFEILFRSRSTVGTQSISTLLESPFITDQKCQPLARYSICAGPPRIVNDQLQLWTPALGEIIPFLNHQLQSRFINSLNLPAPELPFTGGWLGWLGYDLAWEIEKLPHLNPDPLPFPVAYWYEPANFAILDHQAQHLWLATSEPEHLDQLQHQLEHPHPPILSPPYAVVPRSPHFHLCQTDYETAVLKAKKYIQAGDIFQANLSLRFETQTTASSWDIYRALNHINPSPFASYWQTPWGDIISCSPERLVQLQNRHAQTRPIAGTRPRGSTPEQDLILEKELLSNTKERAEHIMLVDLERNDLGRVCEWGSVVVDELLTIERYSHVMHLVSNVAGTLKPHLTAADLIRALFPGGTITGCPKVRCMEIIEELEPVRRNLFYGSCGYLDWRGNLDLNILIRTLLYETVTPHSSTQGLHTVWGQIGAGIVADSNPETEWYESLNKAKAQLTALQVTQPNSS